jgi:hypothetical protein
MTTNVEHTAKCLRCHRTLRSASSVSAGYGPVCRARIRVAALNEAIKGFSLAQVDKARELIADGGILPTNRLGIYRSVSSRGDGTYLTHRNGCNCPAGLRGRGACYHMGAARILAAA